MNKTPPLHYCVFRTPVGRFSVAVDGAGAVAATAFGSREALRRRVKGAELVADARTTGAVRKQVREWFAGSRRAFSVKLAPAGSSFQRRVWTALGRIPYGTTRSYGEMARALGTSPRAVGRANATNPICLIVPCHRVVGADGSLTGYAYGEARKRRLLRLEAS